MSEKRKAEYVFLLKKQGNKYKKLELFNRNLFEKYTGGRFGKRRFRLRLNGKWFPKGEKRYFYMSEIRDMIWRSLKNL
jgi:hypothetical protein